MPAYVVLFYFLAFLPLALPLALSLATVGAVGAVVAVVTVAGASVAMLAVGSGTPYAAYTSASGLAMRLSLAISRTAVIPPGKQALPLTSCRCCGQTTCRTRDRPPPMTC